jgi:hypothetical protein
MKSLMLTLFAVSITVTHIATPASKPQPEQRIVLGKIGPHDALEITPDGTVVQVKAPEGQHWEYTDRSAVMSLSTAMIVVHPDACRAMAAGQKPKSLPLFRWDRNGKIIRWNPPPPASR